MGGDVGDLRVRPRAASISAWISSSVIGGAPAASSAGAIAGSRSIAASRRVFAAMKSTKSATSPSRSGGRVLILSIRVWALAMWLLPGARDSATAFGQGGPGWPMAASPAAGGPRSLSAWSKRCSGFGIVTRGQFLLGREFDDRKSVLSGFLEIARYPDDGVEGGLSADFAACAAFGDDDDAGRATIRFTAARSSMVGV